LDTRACLDQLLTAIRSLTLLCNHSQSKTRLIAIMNLVVKLGIIYATACHASLCTTALDCLSVSCHCHHTALITIYKHGTGRGVSESVAAAAGALHLCKVLCWLLLIASRNTSFVPLPDRVIPTAAHWPPKSNQTTLIRANVTLVRSASLLSPHRTTD